VLEADGNVSWDLLALSPAGLQLQLTTTPQSGVIKPLRLETTTLPEPIANALAVDSASPPPRLLTGDFNNDSWQDAVVSRGSNLLTFLGSGGRFSASPAVLNLASEIRGLDFGDLDRDGDLDLVVATAAGIRLVMNQSDPQCHWLDVRLKGLVDNVSGRMNHLGIGSLLELRSGDKYQAQVVSRSTTHFGLGSSPGADVLRVVMTNGVPQAVLRPSADQMIFEEMALKGSCPYAYAWNGERFEFFTDLLWAAPIGLQLAEGQLAPSRPWEYLKLPGERLRARDGQYLLRVTEELWEAAYFDQIELIAVDHPADVEVFSNEKVGPPSIAEFKLHTVRQRRSPVAARDMHGRDVLPDVEAADGRYFQGFQRRFCQGLVEEHFLELDLELDLGPLKQPRQITLFLTGWIYPTDTSLNVAIGQNSQLRPPQPPSLWVPDATGRWQQVVPLMGFPGGKPKTIAVDLSGIFPAADYRLRIATSHEIFWDEAFFTVDEPRAETRMTTLPLLAAELRDRGFSHRQPRRGAIPETFDYDRVESAPRWPPMRGQFTRYGDVRELLVQVDDRLLVMGAGDEVALAFAALDAPPPGWRRDFILHNVGWDKDADLNTVYGQTVEPLPSVGMRDDPFASDKHRLAGDDYQRYLETYQTRQQSYGAFWRVLK
jgi:hypothetical protein